MLEFALGVFLIAAAMLCIGYLVVLFYIIKDMKED